MDKKLEVLLSLHDGVLRPRELRLADVSAAQVRAAVEQGELLAHSGGLVSSRRVEFDWLDARRRGAELACVSAARVRGLWVLSRPDLCHVSVTTQDFDGPFVVHRRTKRSENAGLLGLLHECSNCLPELEALVIIESAVSLKRVSFGALRQYAERTRGRRLRWILQILSPSSESLLETVARYHLQRAGFSVQVQKYVPGLGRLDLMVDGHLGIELDGRAHHTSVEAFAEDRRRNNAVVLKGIPTLRFTYADVIGNPAGFIDQVRCALVAIANQKRN